MKDSKENYGIRIKKSYTNLAGVKRQMLLSLSLTTAILSTTLLVHMIQQFIMYLNVRAAELT